MVNVEREQFNYRFKRKRRVYECICAGLYNESIFYIRPRARAYFLYDRNSRSLMFLLSPDRAKPTEIHRSTPHKTDRSNKSQ